MIAILVKGSQALGVHDQDLNWIALRRETLDGFAPDPDSLFDKYIKRSAFFFKVIILLSRRMRQLKL